jgi:lipopolysaccharide export system permease protein
LKTINKLVLGSYLGPFMLTFLIAMFVLLMQFVWKYVDDFVGKGLEWYIIAELMFYVSATLVPMALPLAVLLASIMTFGNLAENYELTALKSAGISLQRTMRPLIVTSVALCVIAFLFSNYVLPVANLKMGSLLYDITHQKPALDIKEGVFYNGINDITLRVGKKNNKTNQLYDILIYDHSQRAGNNKVIMAKEGMMSLSDDEKYLVLSLFDGSSYEEVIRNKPGEYKPHMKVTFKEQKILLDLSDFKMVRSDESLFKDNYQMLNIKQLTQQADTQKIKLRDRQKVILGVVSRSLQIDSIKSSIVIAINDSTQKRFPAQDFMNPLSKEQKHSLTEYALNAARTNMAYANSAKADYKNSNENINRYYIERHKKFTLSFACLLLFFIGAPLGAIIRKGGLGMPMVVSVILFIIFHVLTITGEKFSREGVMEPWEGTWMASFILLPLGIWLTYKATRDSALFDIEAYLQPIKNIFARKNANSASVS